MRGVFVSKTSDPEMAINGGAGTLSLRGRRRDPIIVVERRYVHLSRNGNGTRRHLGARRLTLETGEVVRHVGDDLFEVVDTGELIRRLR